MRRILLWRLCLDPSPQTQNSQVLLALRKAVFLFELRSSATNTNAATGPTSPTSTSTSTSTSSTTVPNNLKDPASAKLELADLHKDKDDAFPDGGFTAWMTVVAGFSAHAILFGIVYSFGIFNAHYLSEGIGTSFQVSLIGSLSTVFIPGLGILSGKLANRFGFQRMILIGSLVLSSGLFISSFTTNSLPLLVIFQGAMFGIGASLVYFPALNLPSQYFQKRRALAIGIASSGTGIGGLLFSFISDKCLSSIGIGWTLRTMSLVCLVLLLSAVPFFKTRLPTSTAPLDFSVVREPRFIALLFAACLSNFAMFVSLDYLPRYAKEALGFSISDGATLIAIYNICSTIGRIGMGLLSDAYLGPTNTLILSLWITAIANFVWLTCKSFVSLAFFSAVNGLFGGAVWGLLPVVIASLFGAGPKLMSLVACLYSVLSIGNFFSPITTSYIVSEAGFFWMIIFAGCVATVSALCGTTCRLIHDSRIWIKV
ncbi:MFS general substrate transporter [Rhizoclosmatium globosum]|uniref:MFS general substrate transporter n=1 Tax=Rhizoclosmatium globosum TaxID=329046 RepID=A0A1Y2BUM0_9FUNG|nr:MFS general substrate transporter [Rhizoclosmatium globosum]|eukprot:ORY38433.1 MFS general substrate transporter [Rhizoclosmatium globosum]